MSMKKELAVVIGRFQPLHVMHEHILREADRLGDTVLVLVGSSRCARNIKNPFTFEEREAMIKKVLPSAVIMPIVDYAYDDEKWISQVQSIVTGVGVNYIANDNPPTVLVGHKKDSSSFYLNMFPSWEYHDVPPSRRLDATTIRHHLFSEGYVDETDNIDSSAAQLFLSSMISPSVMSYIDFFTETEEYKNLVEEYSMVKKYKDSWKSAPYQPTFVTTDAVVTCAGHVLMVRRKFAPGKGLLALPGGFLNPGERIEAGILRELKEETGINVGSGLLRSYMKTPRVFDHPERSLRGRTITHAAHIPLSFTALPEVKGDDDAEVAMWVPYNDLSMNREQVFEDHIEIVNSLVGLSL